MKVNNNNNLNTQFKANLLQAHIAKQGVQGVNLASSVVPAHVNFNNTNLVSVPNKTQQYSSSNISVLNLYTPKQLLSAYSHPDFVNSLVEANPKVGDILASKGLEVNINPSIIKNITNTHLTTTTAYALQIADKLGLSQADKKDLELACVFHDFGKILIPQEIINKPDSLTQNEKEIIDLHAELGYELLSSTKMNDRVLNLIKNHHMPQNQNSDILGQILSVADIYSALREERSYKQELQQEDALYLLDQKALKGEVSTEVVEALKSSIVSGNVA
ncbi:MAG: HD domain-containing protein [Candidatus Gastranaerophilales bacterium]|nr:HD domain-containing protein [Candidatus Gastranaerophilales bacterium]